MTTRGRGRLLLIPALAACLVVAAGCGDDSSDGTTATGGAAADGKDLSGQEATFVTFGGAETRTFVRLSPSRLWRKPDST